MAESHNHSVSRTRIKVCGITRREDALTAIAAGADALGFVFYPPSPRALSFEAAARILEDLPAFVSRVGLFLDAGQDEISMAMHTLPLDIIQFHGGESPGFCESFGRPYIKALGKDINGSRAEIANSYTQASALLFDSHATGEAGGTGKSFDWTQIPASIKKPLILAGGLNAENVADAIRQIRPYAVDVSSGVESAPGLKDAAKINQFVAQVRIADSE